MDHTLRCFRWVRSLASACSLFVLSTWREAVHEVTTEIFHDGGQQQMHLFGFECQIEHLQLASILEEIPDGISLQCTALCPHP